MEYVQAAGAIIGGLGKMFGGGGSAPSAAYSGMGPFSVTNTPVYNKSAFDLENPIHILVLGVLVVGGIYAYKRFK